MYNGVRVGRQKDTGKESLPTKRLKAAWSKGFHIKRFKI
jgi:hypothetical protein